MMALDNEYNVTTGEEIGLGKFKKAIFDAFDRDLALELFCYVNGEEE